MAAHVVMFSGGIGSWAAAKRTAQQYGTDDLYLVFADVLGEDPDCYRFIRESAAAIGGELIWLTDGRTIWEVFHDQKLLGNSRLAPCSHTLKQRPARRWLKDNTDAATTTVVIGIDWSETHRLPAVQRGYNPWTVSAPMTEPPYMDKQAMLDWCRREGIEPPRMYAEGFPHANCAGGCVRAGHAQFRLLLKQRPEVFAEWETQEEKLRGELGEVAILNDRTTTGINEYRRAHPDAPTGTGRVPLTLRTLRERIEADSQPSLFDDNDYGGCGCFLDDVEGDRR